MHNHDKGIIRLQPRQLYDMVVAYQITSMVDLDLEHVPEFGVYTDSQSISCAINDFKKIRQNTRGTIELTLEPLQQKTDKEEHIPYLHDKCANNAYFAHVLGLDVNKGKITFSNILMDPNQSIQQHNEMILEMLGGMYIQSDCQDKAEQHYEMIRPQTRAERRALLNLEFFGYK